MNCRGDEDIDAKRSRPSIGKPVMGHARKERVVLFGTDQRITSGPAAKRPHSKAEYMTAPEPFADSPARQYTSKPLRLWSVGLDMRRREFIGLVSGAAAWPLMASAAAGDAADRISRRRFTDPMGALSAGISPGAGRDRVCQGPKCGDRIPLGAG
jgi:hypothetical protein